MPPIDPKNAPAHKTTIMNPIGQSGTKNLLCHCESMNIYQEHFFQNEVQQRFYRFTTDCYLFVLDGQAFLQNQNQECTIKPNQGVWLEAESNNKLVPLSNQLNCLLVKVRGAPLDTPFNEYMRVQSTGTANKSLTASNNNQWVLSEHPNVKIEVELLPEQHNEPLHYHRFAQQFIVSLTDTITITQPERETTLSPKEGLLILAKSKHKIVNNNAHSAQILNVYSPRAKHDKVLVLGKKHTPT